MKIKSTFLATISSIAFLSNSAEAVLVAAWNFNELSITTAGPPGTGSIPTTISASSGSGTVGLAGWNGNVASFAGSTLNAVNSDAAGASLSLAGGGTAEPFPGNGSFITIAFSTIGLTPDEGIIVSFATRGTSTGFNSSSWAYSTNGTDFTALATAPITATRDTTFAVATVDFSSVEEILDVSTVTLRYTLDGASTAGGNNRIDNLQVNAVPEPSVAVLGAIGALGLLRRRR